MSDLWLALVAFKETVLTIPREVRNVERRYWIAMVAVAAVGDILLLVTR